MGYPGFFYLRVTPCNKGLTCVAGSLGQGWTYYSAVCWLYGKHLYETLGYPIGLVESCWGGTPVEAWSSPDALKVCGLKRSEYVEFMDLLNCGISLLPTFKSSVHLKLSPNSSGSFCHSVVLYPVLTTFAVTFSPQETREIVTLSQENQRFLGNNWKSP